LIEISVNKLKQNFLHISAGLRSSTFLSEARSIYWCGAAGDILKQEKPVEFDYKIKVNNN
jgi:hypothetical protein